MLYREPKVSSTPGKKWLHSDGNSMFWPCYWITPWIHTFWVHRSGIHADWLLQNSSSPMEPVRTALIQYKCQNMDSPWWQNRFFRCWGALCTLVDHLSWVKMCPGGVSQHCLPSQLDQKICIYGLIQYQWPEHWLAFMALPVFQVLMCLLVLGRASLMGERVSKWNQSSLCATIVG